jgi:putative PIN family toxin of toxin-antitoxin system
MPQPTGERVFPDTNVLLSGMLFKGNERYLLELAAEGVITLVIGEIVLLEARRVLSQRFPAHASALDKLLSIIPHETIPLPTSADLLPHKGVLRDPSDLPILVSAIKAQVHAFITGDADLLTQQIRAIIPAMRCAEYLKRIRAE